MSDESKCPQCEGRGRMNTEFIPSPLLLTGTTEVRLPPRRSFLARCNWCGGTGILRFCHWRVQGVPCRASAAHWQTCGQLEHGQEPDPCVNRDSKFNIYGDNKPAKDKA